MARTMCASSVSSNKMALWEEQQAKRKREKEEETTKKLQKREEETTNKLQKSEEETTNRPRVDSGIEMEEADGDRQEGESSGVTIESCIEEGHEEAETDGEKGQAQGESRGEQEKPINGFDGMERFLNRSGVVASRPNTVCARSKGGW